MWSIIGHTQPIESLNKALLTQNPAHAYVFSGPEQVGKLTVALEFAAALNCDADSKPCLECRSCRDTLASRHTDVELVEPGSICDDSEHRDHADSRDLRICQIRRLERILTLSSYWGRRRVAIVDGADTLRTEAANAFLKTLEEPPANTVIILLVEREEHLPDTVLSRCQRLTFRRIDRKTIQDALVNRGAAAETADQIAAVAEGRLGWAIRVLDDPSLLAERGIVLDTIQRLAHGSRPERFNWAKEADSRAPDVRERFLRELELWQLWWRDVLTIASGGIHGIINLDRESELREEGKLYTPAEVVAFLRALRQTREHLQANVDPQLALENLMLDLPRPRAVGVRA